MAEGQAGGAGYAAAVTWDSSTVAISINNRVMLIAVMKEKKER